MGTVVNQTKGTVVARELTVAASMWSRFWGLMLRRELPAGQALLIKPSSSIHTAFMRFSIDVVFVDKGNTVVKVVNRIKPFRAALSRGHSALELPAGTARAAAIERGDQLVMENGASH
jgi:uncharacterized membrane protein (UPF0127 family)